MSPRVARVGIIGDFRPEYRWHQLTNAALELAAAGEGLSLECKWVPTPEILGRAAEALGGFDGYWVSPGSPYESYEGTLEGIRFARESARPLVAT
jgi:CTP synthase (UTP-ammonia lyase)